MFVYKGHPARRFLNAVAEACEGNHGDVPQERELLDHVPDHPVFQAFWADARADSFEAPARVRAMIAAVRVDDPGKLADTVGANLQLTIEEKLGKRIIDGKKPGIDKVLDD